MGRISEATSEVLVLRLVLISALMLSGATGCLAQQGRRPLADKDKRTIVGLVLRETLSGRKRGDQRPGVLDSCRAYHLQNDRVIFISTLNIRPDIVPRLPGFHFELMTPDEIYREVDTNKRHCYIEFNGISVKAGKVTVHLQEALVGWGGCEGCAKSLYADGTVYEARKVSAGWRIRRIRKYQLVS
jgi:hypothetical protein